ncbi:nwd2 [Moniliophthora roreri MCA 2997]|uniref:Nwd2 n=1 Tax=Moniliophthora roreri (strain MCA 2997) TaxID=1381753 RepID=V2XKW2_MONRO|nr:nwd2 [Moniliophthora roreri MCA 2997]
MFQNASGFSIGYGVFNNVGRDQIVYELRDSESPLGLLSEVIKGVGAAHDSAARSPPPKCHPETRLEILAEIQGWILNPSTDESPVFWVHGPTGTGKSAIAQTIAGWNRDEYFFLTLAHQMAERIPELRDAITEIIDRNPDVLKSSTSVQFRELLRNAVRLAIKRSGSEWMRHPMLILIDALDECRGTLAQQGIIGFIALALEAGLPFRFLLFSQSEPQICEAFDNEAFCQHSVRQFRLDDSPNTRRDIRKVLETGFAMIRTSPRNAHIPETWPPLQALDQLVDKACGQFIYASTVLKFVDDEGSNPVTQLSIVLGLSPPAEGSSPFKNLDILYDQVLRSNPHRRRVVTILGTLMLTITFNLIGRVVHSPQSIERFLGLPAGEASSTLRGMHSILDVGDSGTNIRILHTSFTDYLYDKSRSGPFYVFSPYTLVIIGIHILRSACHGRIMTIAIAIGFAICLWFIILLLYFALGWGLYLLFSNKQYIPLLVIVLAMAMFLLLGVLVFGNYLLSRWRGIQ